MMATSVMVAGPDFRAVRFGLAPAGRFARLDFLVALPAGPAVTGRFVLLSVITFRQGVKRYTGATS
ncbi:hypothetical protein [Streptomyces sp. NPDC060035]|uniref:hypothetical protein n=1 Tax=Streptomyces sp. NPDC060035 TaxID=3347044 RepID=UPI003678B9B3